MKTDTFFRRATRATAWMLGTALVFAHAAAQACPGCKQNMTPGAGGATPPLNGTSIGFGLSIFFMIAMIAGLLGGLGFMMYRSCQKLAAHQRAILEAEEIGASGGLPARA